MTPIILVSSDLGKIEKYKEELRKKYNIPKSFVFEIRPKGKEISIDQIRDVKKDVIYTNTKSRLLSYLILIKPHMKRRTPSLKRLRSTSKYPLFVSCKKPLQPCSYSLIKIKNSRFG